MFLPLLAPNWKGLAKSAIPLYCALILTVTPWLLRNYHIFGAPTLAHTIGINLLDGNNPYATGGHYMDERVNALLGELKTKPLEFMFDGKEVERDRKARDVAMDYMLSHPGNVVALWPRKIVALFLSDVDGFYYSMGG